MVNFAMGGAKGKTPDYKIKITSSNKNLSQKGLKELKSLATHIIKEAFKEDLNDMFKKGTEPSEFIARTLLMIAVLESINDGSAFIEIDTQPSFSPKESPALEEFRELFKEFSKELYREISQDFKNMALGGEFLYQDFNQEFNDFANMMDPNKAPRNPQQSSQGSSSRDPLKPNPFGYRPPGPGRSQGGSTQGSAPFNRHDAPFHPRENYSNQSTGSNSSSQQSQGKYSPQQPNHSDGGYYSDTLPNKSIPKKANAAPPKTENRKMPTGTEEAKVSFKKYAPPEFTQYDDKKALRKAYLKSSLKVHPDKGGNQEDFKELGAAYNELLKSAV